jgi:hypothetical protein
MPVILDEVKVEVVGAFEFDSDEFGLKIFNSNLVTRLRSTLFHRDTSEFLKLSFDL